MLVVDNVWTTGETVKKTRIESVGKPRQTNSWRENEAHYPTATRRFFERFRTWIMFKVWV